MRAENGVKDNFYSFLLMFFRRFSLTLPFMKTWLTVMVCILFLGISRPVNARLATDTLLLNLIYHYGDSNYVRPVDTTYYSFTRYTIDIRRKNFVLMAVPNLFDMARVGRRHFMGESLRKHTYNHNGGHDVQTLVSYTTLPHGENVLPPALMYLSPKLYNVTLVDKFLLSPFNRHNKMFYHLKFISQTDSLALLSFKPKVDNTQLVKGNAIIDKLTGRVMTCHLEGEYNMLHFELDTDTGDKTRDKLTVKNCILRTTFKFMGNQMAATYRVNYHLAPIDSTNVYPNKPAFTINALRPDTLTRMEKEIFLPVYLSDIRQDSVKTDAERPRGQFWRKLGDYLVDRIGSDFGKSNQGYFRLNAPFDPFYMELSPRRGFTYMNDFRLGYTFSSHVSLFAQIKVGYFFREKRVTFYAPLVFYFNRQRNFYSRLEVSTGNRIYSSTIADRVSEPLLNRFFDIGKDLYQFTDRYFKFDTNIDLSEKLGVRVGFVFHKRKPLDPSGFEMLSFPKVFRSFAPSFELSIRPLGWKGPIFTIDYERSLTHAFKSNTSYERWEIDGQYLHRLSRLRALSMRLGTGFYTQKGRSSYFLDYSNFRENTIPGGWNDGWSGEFELLNASWYNASNYYVRGNFTYETPLLALSWLPFVGHYIEMERIYVSALSVKALHPYIECGYGFTTRLFTIGGFVSSRNWKFESIGLKFGFELFRHW